VPEASERNRAPAKGVTNAAMIPQTRSGSSTSVARRQPEDRQRPTAPDELTDSPT
jgi:hypothetical protein